MSLLQSTGERLRRATQLWHAYLSVTGQRFELAQFLKDAGFERQTLQSALASGDRQLVSLAQEWMRDTGQPVPALPAARATSSQPAAAAAPDPAGQGGKPNRYLRGVR